MRATARPSPSTCLGCRRTLGDRVHHCSPTTSPCRDNTPCWAKGGEHAPPDRLIGGGSRRAPPAGRAMGSPSKRSGRRRLGQVGIVLNSHPTWRPATFTCSIRKLRRWPTTREPLVPRSDHGARDTPRVGSVTGGGTAARSSRRHGVDRPTPLDFTGSTTTRGTGCVRRCSPRLPAEGATDPDGVGGLPEGLTETLEFVALAYRRSAGLHHRERCLVPGR